MPYRQEVRPGREASPEDPCARRKLHFEELSDEIEPLGRDPRLQDVQGLLTTRGRHASCGIAQDDGGVFPRAEDRQRDGEVAASHPLRGGSLDPDPHRCHPASRRPGRDDREGADAASRFMNAALVALKKTGTGACPNPVFGTACGEGRPLAPQADPENRLRSKRSTSGRSACGASGLLWSKRFTSGRSACGASGLLWGKRSTLEQAVYIGKIRLRSKRSTLEQAVYFGASGLLWSKRSPFAT
jgi:hypothetical protein